MFEVSGLFFSVGHKRILRGVSFHARTGDILGVVGLNGSGKTTMFRCLVGLNRTPFLSMRLDGEALPPDLSRAIGYMSQESFLPYTMTASQAIQSYFGSASLPGFASRPPVADFLQTRVGALSGGERRYLEAVMVLSLQRPVTILDEPFSELEPINQERLKHAILERSTSGVVLVSDHQYQAVLGVSTRIALMRGGTFEELSKDQVQLRKSGYLK